VAETATAKLASLVPMAPVADVQRSIDFYAQLGFEVGSTFEEDGILHWVYLQNGGAHLMLSRADPPVPRARQTMVIYFYAEDVAAYHRELRDKGLDAGPLEQRFYMESGEFELKDPDGYCLLVGHT
jgi:catechol 2,3-dioxygenase-like lactoylglutathione lyase family enzyme